jgi:uncharacterized protein (TIGR03083 family)
MSPPVPQLRLDEHLSALRQAAERLAASAHAAGLEAAVPTCPGWTVRDLLAHQGMVHRWATAHVTGDREGQHASDAVEAAGRAQPDPAGWLREGADALLAALTAAPEDLDALVFLKDAPPAREFWARRQCHETTVHAVDGLAAELGRVPTATEAGVTTPVAIDGIDELVTGFLTRGKARLRSPEPQRIAVSPNDADAAWLLEVSQGPVVTTRHTASSLSDADVTLRGTAAQLYLGLWNRGREVEADDGETLGRWRELARITWA